MNLPEFSLDPKQPLVSRNKNPSLRFASGQRPLSCIENPQPANRMVSCWLRPFPQEGPLVPTRQWLTFRSQGSKRRIITLGFSHSPQTVSGKLYLPTLIFLPLQCLLFTKHSNLAISPVYKKKKKAADILGSFCSGTLRLCLAKLRKLYRDIWTLAGLV